MHIVKASTRLAIPRAWVPWGWSLLIHALLIGGAWWFITTARPSTSSGVHPIFIPAAHIAPSIPVAPLHPMSPQQQIRLAAFPPAWSHGSPEPIRVGVASEPVQSQATHFGADRAPSSLDPLMESRLPPGPFPLPQQAPALPAASIFNDAGSAPSVAYVCDASGSMSADRLGSLKVELRRAIDALLPIQSFTVIFFKQDQTDTLSPDLVMANDFNKRRAAAFLDRIESGGTTDPVAGLNRAFDAKPAVIYLLTDGEFPDAAAVQNCIARRNPRHEVKINTLAFLGAGREYEAILRRIAAKNGGTFKRVTREELNRQRIKNTEAGSRRGE